MNSSGPGEPPFARVGIAGLGLVGGSVALAARRAWPSISLTACDRVLDLQDPTVRDIVNDLVEGTEGLAGCDLVVLAVPTDQVSSCLQELARTGTDAVVTDVGSTKRRVMAAAESTGLRTFVGGHPMAGGERPGLAFAKHDLFQHRPWLLVPGSGDSHACARLERFVVGLGALVEWTDAVSHDRTVAYVSHLPQILAAALMNAADGALGAVGQRAAGNAFGEMTRLASSPPEMWHAVLAENADFVVEALAAFVHELPSGAGAAPGDWAREALARSGEARTHWRHAKDGQR